MNRPIWQRIGAVLCCLLFICCFGFRITVEAVFTEGVVIGGTMAATEAALGEATTVAIGSSGLTDQLKDAANAAGQSVQAFVNDRIAAYNSVASGSTLLPLMAVDLMRSLAYTPDGKLIFSEEFASAFSSFMNWMSDNGDIVIPSTGGTIEYPALSGSVTITNLIDGYDFFVDVLSKMPRDWDISSVSSEITSFFAENTGCVFNIRIYNNTNAYDGRPLYIYAYPSLIVGSTAVFDNGYASNFISFRGKGSENSKMILSSVSSGSGNQALKSNNFTSTNSWYVNINASSTGATSGLDVWNDADEDGVVLDPTGLLGDALAGLEGAIANVGDYIDTLANVIAGVQNPALPVVGVGDIPISIPADITIPANPALPADRVDDVPVTGEDTMPAYTGTGDYTLPLADFFPFCIPFDIYKMLSLLSADPVAPSVDYPFPLPGGGTYTIHIDLSQFDSVAQVLRTIEILAFCVGLGFATKKLLFGS